MIKNLLIPFENKFTEVNIESFIDSYFTKSIDENLNEIIFDLEKLEWISPENVTYLFAWLRKIVLVNKRLIIKLPYSYIKFPGDNVDILDRRKFVKFYLWKVWGISSNVGIKDYNFENTGDINTLIDQYKNSKIGKKVLPFQILDTQLNKNRNIDLEFQALANISDNSNIFKIDSEIYELLTKNNCYSPFENKVISDIITKELVMNSLEHAKTPECYFTTTLRDKWDYTNTQKFTDQFVLEKEKDTLSFFRDKDECLKIVKREVSRTEASKILGKRTADLNRIPEYNIFKNQSFLEFTFIDFGTGIFHTLEKEFMSNREKYINEKVKLSNNFTKKHLHSQILEYAFLLESSKDPFDREIEYFDLIPRGLYFLIDMVRRYKGLLIARSGFGKVIYDFSDRIYIQNNSDKLFVKKERVYTAKESIIDTNSANTFFPGTMISIILPERKTLDFKKSGVRIDDLKLNNTVFNRNNSDEFPKEIFRPESYEYLSVSFIYKVAETNIDYNTYNSKLGELNQVFKIISKKLQALEGKNCVLFIDLEYLPNRDAIYKILFYLSNSPLVNEYTKVIILNLLDDEFSLIKEYEIEFLEKNTSFLFKPIPCLKINKIKNQVHKIDDLKWIGVGNIKDEKKLTNLFFGHTDSIDIGKFEDCWLCEGNIFSQFQGRVYSIFHDFKDLIDKAKEAQLKEIENWIENEIIDGEVIFEGKKRLFLTSKGTYQTKYLSLYEPLNFKYTAQYFAQFLLDKYIDNCISQYEKTQNVNFENIDIESKFKILKTFRFNKILVVTVSSQLLGVEVRNLIKDNDKYIFLRNDTFFEEQKIELDKYKKARLKDCPTLIKLSSYFSFEEERPFKEINENLNILIVNDVISTGSLIERIKYGIEKKGATVVGVLTIADSRTRFFDELIEFPSIFFDENFENKVISISTSESNPNLKLSKLKKKPEGEYLIKRINPILNSIVSIKAQHTEKLKILFEDPNELFESKDVSFSHDIFRIGHYKQNLSCNSYFTNMPELFFDENGYNLLKIIKERIENNSYVLNLSKLDTIKANLLNAQNNLLSIDEFKFLSEDQDKLKESLEHIAALLKQTDNENNNFRIKPNPKIVYRPYIIFHPVYSGIEEVTDDVFHEVFKTDKANIISLQRYQTKNGWRFPFPAKRLNNLAKKQHVLIIDSGALSGKSLVQLIDSIAFLEVSRIDVISIIGRLEDYHREFYSRLKSIKVKNLNEGTENDNRDTIVNLNVLFGINLHIPSYHSEDVCPFCKEIKTLEKYLIDDFKRDRLPEEAKEYIEARIDEIRQIENFEKKVTNYLPLNCVDNFPDFKNIFLMRDKLGKVDSYRFFEEYFKDFDDLSNKVYPIEKLFIEKNSLKKIELILICVLHEPNLMGILKDLLINIFDLCNFLITKIILKEKSLNDLYYQWKEYSFLRLYFIFNANDFYTLEKIEKIVTFLDDDKYSMKYLSFLFIEPLLKNRESQQSTEVILILNEISKKFDSNTEGIYQSLTFRKIIKSIFYSLEPVNSNTNFSQALFNLGLFFETIYVEDHKILLKNKISFLAINIDNEDVKQKSELISIANEILNNFKEGILNNLYVIKKSSLFKIFEKTELFNKNSIFEDIKKIENLYEEIQQKDDLNSNLFFDMLREYLTKIKEIQNKHLIKGKYFYDFAINFSFNVKKLLSKVVDSSNVVSEKNKRNNFKIDLSNVVEQTICGNEKVFFFVFEEIILNSVKRKNHDNTSLIISTEKDELTQGLNIIFFQDKPWEKDTDSADEKKSNGGFHKIISSFFEEKNGIGTIEETKGVESYTITLKLLNPNLQSNE